MGSRVECFVMTPIERGRYYLRRYAEGSCAGRYGYHNANVLLGEDAYPDDGWYGCDVNELPRDDPRWPKRCDCGFEFADAGHWQHRVERLFSGAPDGVLRTTHDMPPGALYLADWWPEKGPDGHGWACILPPGGDANMWLIDGKSKGGGHWTRNGTAPKFTVTPSIQTPEYHGYLTDGFLVEC